MIAPRVILSLPDRAHLSNGRSGLRIRVRGATLDFSGRPPHIRRALRQLRDGAVEDDLAGIGGGRDGATLAEWYYCVMMLERKGGLAYAVRAGSAIAARGMALSPWFEPAAEWRTAVPPSRVRLSRFAYIHRVGGRLVLESPLSCGRIELHHPAVSEVLSALAEPCQLSELARATRAFSAETVRDLVWLFGYFGMLTAVTAVTTAEDEDPVLRTWHFADILFHSRSRAGRHDEVFETFRHLGSLDPPPVVKPAMSSRTIPLYKPRMAAVAERDPRFTRVLEERRSIRDYGRTPMTLRQLGEFLYRSARVKAIHRANGRDFLYDCSRRPYPGGGACYELELYVAVRRCRGLEPGWYHYDPMRHRLEVLAADKREIARLIAEARSPIGRDDPHVVITLAARFQRLTWKYNSSAYGPILKNVGVLLQTMYLVATAMRLAPCAVGGGNSERFAALAGTRYLEESSVGEFLLGSRPVGWRP